MVLDFFEKDCFFFALFRANSFCSHPLEKKSVDADAQMYHLLMTSIQECYYSVNVGAFGMALSDDIKQILFSLSRDVIFYRFR
jgi:hypothetical protein